LAEEGANVIAFKHSYNPYQPVPAKHPRIHWLCLPQIEAIAKYNSVLQAICQLCIKLYVFTIALMKADACLFIGGKGFSNYPIDYYLLRLFGKRVVHMYVGTASRPRYMSSYAMGALSKEPAQKDKNIKKLARRTRRQQRRVSATSRAATLVIESPLCGHFQTKPFVNFFKLGVPMNIIDTPPAPEDSRCDGRKTRILHCPSQPKIKGTDRIKAILTEEALEKLNAELIILTGVPHETVLDEIEKCDFVIDQLYSDSPLAGFAAEAASYNKVPVVGGYGWAELEKTLPPEDIPPTMLCHPDQLLETIEALCRAPSKQTEVAKKLQDFLVDGEWSGKRFAEKLGCVLTGNIPASWMVAPETIRYKHGVGLSEEQVKEIISRLVAYGGISALQLKDKSRMESPRCPNR
jgi:hypothetical protein